MANRAEERQEVADLVDQVYAQMLALLSQRPLPASEILNVASLAGELGVSRTPVTMALVRLQCDGLVSKLAGGGWITAEFSPTDLDEVIALREVLDTLVMQKVVQRATPEDVAVLFGIVDQMQAAADARDVDRWIAQDQAYESYLLDLTGNSWLRQLEKKLHKQVYRMMLTNLLVSDRMAVSTREHRDMTEAIASGDPDAAVGEALRHLLSMKSSLLDVYSNILQPLRGQRR